MLSADHKSVKFVTKDTDIERGKLKLRTPERWQSGRMRRFAKPLYGLTPVPRVRIPPSPPDFLRFYSLPLQSNSELKASVTLETGLLVPLGFISYARPAARWSPFWCEDRRVHHSENQMSRVRQQRF